MKKEFKYSVEMLGDKEWRTDVRIYYKEQNVKDFKDNKFRKNFKKI